VIRHGVSDVCLVVLLVLSLVLLWLLSLCCLVGGMLVGRSVEE